MGSWFGCVSQPGWHVLHDTPLPARWPALSWTQPSASLLRTACPDASPSPGYSNPARLPSLSPPVGQEGPQEATSPR